jgi:GMP synthase (glutamine-hydrolysing)
MTIFPCHRGLTKKQEVLLTHGDSVEKIADGFKSVAMSGSLVAAISNENSHIYGLQFHPEVKPSLSVKSIKIKKF